MGSDQRNAEEAIFYRALELTSPTARAAYVKEACGADCDLLERVRALLKVDGIEDGFLVDPPAVLDIAAPSEVVTEAPGTVIGRYKLLEKIGEGGMALVYMAEQEQPIRRKVALKIIKLGMDTRQVIARFEAERQALALMDHPNIAKVLDAGATETGRPYFVMELVQGVSITEYCDRNSLSTKDRLALFVQVCNAVQHAHQKGIIHRDIKPSNVMVTHHDGKPIPKVIDFGIAKATNQRLTEKTLFTRYAHLIGTPAYMSPEQAELSDLDIDTRTDIYSLGVLLYELLTGTTPFSEEELRKAGYVEMQRMIREQQPVKPSTRIRTACVAQPPSAGGTGTTPGGGGATRVHSIPYQQVRGDLDWIVMKALEKDRSRRYETAGALAEDVRRHLEHEPVLAHGPGAMYSLRKFLRRRRSQVLAAVALTVIAVAAVVILSMWNRDLAQLAEAESFKHRGILSQAREQYAKADRETAIETIKPILGSKHVGPEARLLQATILVDNRHPDEAMAILSSLLSERPEVAGAAHSLLARILWESDSLGAEKLQEIEEHRKQAETLLFGVPPSGGKDQSDPRKRGTPSAEAYFLRAMTTVTIKEQLASLDKALQLDPRHYESRRLRAFTYYASRKYDKLRDEALGMMILRPRDPLGYALRAKAWRELGRYPEAIADFSLAIALTPGDEPQYVDLRIQQSETFLRMGDYERVIAEATAEGQAVPRVAGILPAIRGRDALDTEDRSPLQYHKFAALTALGEYDAATTLFREIIAPGHEARQKFRDWCAKYVFDTLESGRPWHPPEQEPAGAAFLPMVEAEETYRALAAKGQRLTTGGFSASWSPDGKRLAFSLGVQGYSGVATLDLATKETELLVVPGKDPVWSPNGKFIAFVRDRQNLRLEELAAGESEGRQPSVRDEEVWLICADGTELRRLARGSAPSWTVDSQHVYYQSRVDNVLFSVAIEDAEPRQIMKCSYALLSVSPDNRKVACFEGGSLKIKDLASQLPLAECQVSSLSWGVIAWSPKGNEVGLGGDPLRQKSGLWLYDLTRRESSRALDGPVTGASWSPAGKNLAFCLGPPYSEIWAARLDPDTSAIEVFGPPRTLREHYRDMVALYTRRIKADPMDGESYLRRAEQYHFLHQQAQVEADMKQYEAVVRHQNPPPVEGEPSGCVERVLRGPFGWRLSILVEEHDDGVPVWSVVFGRKGRSEMRSFEIPMFVTSLLSLCFLPTPDSPTARADFVVGTPTNLGSNINGSSSAEIDAHISADGLSLYFASDRAGGNGSTGDIWVAHRMTQNAEWGLPLNLGSNVNSQALENSPSVSVDETELYFSDGVWGLSSPRRPDGYGDSDLWAARRSVRSNEWGPAVNLGHVVNSPSYDGEPLLSNDGLALYFTSNRSGGFGSADIYVTIRATNADEWGPPTNLGPIVNSALAEGGVGLSTDGRVLFFHRTKPEGDFDLWMATRRTESQGWEPPVPLGSTINATGYMSNEFGPDISSDGSTLYFCTHRPGEFGYKYYDLWQAPILPIVDFNADSVVDVNDLALLIDNWGTDDTLYDIGPYAWGDGKVDIEDLKAFIAEWEKETAAPEP
ncbi:MAG TPA: protein kinase [Sedimentisphaerales bacterium]|jgi:serine/threonine protein kinase/Tol biopolymer transport system component|nr:protein kinase [Sedimentisphaerales bacterium]